MGNVILALGVIAGVLLFLLWVYKLEERLDEEAQESIPTFDEALVNVQTNRKRRKQLLEDKYHMVFYVPGECDIHRGYHYGFGHPGCPQDLHHHHDEKCPAGCRG